MPTIEFVPFDPATDLEALVTFLATNTYPYHVRPRLSPAQARELVLGGRFWSDDSAGFWVDAAGERVGMVVIDDLADVADGGNPVFDLRLGEQHRGRRLSTPILRALAALAFERWPGLTRFEGHTRDDNAAMRAAFRRAGWVKEGYFRDAWPVEGAGPRASVTYAVLRRDWESGTTTPVVWDDQ